ncbi:MAG: NAD-dependent epimerase/dehydratase family protein [Vulcanimicrobiota bacterium]
MSLLRHQLAELIQASSQLWSGLAGARLFITGASGFFGCWLLETLLFARSRFGLELEVVALTRDPVAFLERTPHLAGAITLVQGDVRDFPFPNGPFSHVVHAAAEVGSGEGILAGGLRVLRMAERSQAGHCLLVSSGAVYGPSSQFIKEEDDLAPLSEYGKAKLELERVWEERAVSARCFAFLGPYLSLDSGLAAADFFHDALAGQPLRVQGNGLTQRSYLYAGELAVWLWTLLLKGKPGRAYNVGSMQAVPVLELAELIASVAGGLPVQVLGNKAGNDYLPDTTRIQKELGVTQSIALPEAVARTWAWFKSTPWPPT